MRKKILYRIFTFLFLICITIILLACQPPEPETIVKTVIVEKEGQTIIETVMVTVEPAQIPTEEPEAEDENCCGVFRIGIYEEPVSLNYWNYLGPGNSVWTRYVISGWAAQLFEISDQRFQFVPSLATGIPQPIENDDGTWTVRVEMAADAHWSDGEPITANDVAFTHNTCKDLKLTWYWPSFCSPDGTQVDIAVIDDYMLEYTFLDSPPTLRNWQFGVAMSPILPEHFWGETVSQARNFLEDVEIPQKESPENCQSNLLNQADQDICEIWSRYEAAYDQAQDYLYAADGSFQPVAGGYQLEAWEPGENILLIPNEEDYFSGAKFVEYGDGTWQRKMPGGDVIRLYGGARGNEVRSMVYGPFNPSLEYSIYGSQEAAFSALDLGEVDYVLNPIPLPRKLIDKLSKSEKIAAYQNPQYDMFYLAFNMRHYPMSAYEFRKVFDILIDRELVVNEILGGIVEPLYTTMPPLNAFWHNRDISTPNAGLSRADRIESAVQVLKDAGWRWSVEPYWDTFTQDVIPGEGLIMPNGLPMPELTIFGPGPDFDIVRATFNQWISEWAREMGMPVQSELTGRNAILDSVFIAGDYDMYIYGWPSLGNPAYPIYFDEFWHSTNCTFETGGNNTPCFKNEKYDALVDEFNQTNDIERAQELVRQMQVVLADQRPYIPLYSQTVFDFAAKNVQFPYTQTLGGIELRDGFPEITKVLLEK